jgi:16S rRNA (uracil1498-N3)-methyltransferase
MRLHRFYIDTPIDTESVRITDERLVHQWRDVFRYNVGAEMIIFDGSGKEFDVVIEKITRSEAVLKIFDEREGIVPEKKIVLCQSLIKKDKMEWVVEKATELGVSKIIPIVSERSEKKGFNIERANKIAIEASEQSGRADIPEILEPVDLSVELLEEIKKRGFQIVIFDSSGAALETSSSMRSEDASMSEQSIPEDVSQSANKSVAIFVGPEGGWSQKEIEIFKEAKTEIFSLGKLTLRAETAAIAALTILGLQR